MRLPCSPHHVNPSVQQNELLLDILERQERLEQQNKQLISKLEEQQNYINFVERDLLMLRRMKDLVQNKGITLEMASEAVITRLNPPEGTASVLEESREGEQRSFCIYTLSKPP